MTHPAHAIASTVTVTFSIADRAAGPKATCSVCGVIAQGWGEDVWFAIQDHVDPAPEPQSFSPVQGCGEPGCC